MSPSLPAKYRTKTTCLKDTEKTMSIREALTLENFVQDHLSTLPTDYESDYSSWLDENVVSIKRTGNEALLYKHLCDLLNVISKHFHSKYFPLVTCRG